jgi:hypothetical protein
MEAAWRSPGQLGWSKQRALHELQNGLPYRTFPPGHVVDWHDRIVQDSFDVAASTITITVGVFGGPGVGFDRRIIGIEVLPPLEADRADADEAPSRSPIHAPASRKHIAQAELDKCFGEIVDDHPNDPLTEEELLEELETRLGVAPSRKRVRDMWKVKWPNWKRPRGHPLTAKKSAG